MIFRVDINREEEVEKAKARGGARRIVWRGSDLMKTREKIREDGEREREE